MEEKVPWETILITFGILLVYLEVSRTLETVARMEIYLIRAESRLGVAEGPTAPTFSVTQNAPAGQMVSSVGGGANAGGQPSHGRGRESSGLGDNKREAGGVAWRLSPPLCFCPPWCGFYT